MKTASPNAPHNGASERISRTVPSHRFSGHETFPFRYSWLPKAFAELSANRELFSDD